MRRNVAPGSDAELIRDMLKRLTALENASALRVGPWVLSDDSGELVASTPDTTVSVSAPVAAAVADTSPLGRGLIDPANLLTLGDTIPAEDLVGTAPPGLIDLVPTTAIGQGTQELLANPIFSSTAMDSGTEWNHDPSRGYGPNPIAGSLHLSADGLPHAIYADPSRVTPGQDVPMTVQVAWENLVGLATAFELIATGYQEDPNSDDLIPVESVTLATLSALPANSVGATGADVDGWVNMSGTYTAANNDAPIPVTWVTMQIYVTPGVFGGDVWVSGAGMTRVDKPAVLSVDSVHTLPAALANQQNAQLAQMTTGYRNPRWVCRYPVGEVSYPDFANSIITVNGATDNASSGVGHTHTIGATSTVTAVPVPWQILPGNSLGGLITISRAAVMDSIAILGYKTAGFGGDGTLNNTFLELYRLDASGLTMTRIDSIDVSSMFTTTLAYIEAVLPTPAVVVPGEQYMIVLRNSTTNTTSVSIVGVTQSTGLADIGAQWSGANVGLASYSSGLLASGLAATTVQPWVQLAARAPIATAQSWSDDFNRDLIGGQWVLKSSGASQLSITDNQLTYTGSADGWQAGVFTRPVSSDGCKVEGIITPGLLPLLGGSAAQCGFLLHASRDLSQVVYLGVGNGAVTIWSGALGLLTSRASIAWNNHAGVYSLYYDVPSDSYVALKDGAPLDLVWSGVGSAVSHGRDYQFGGVRIESLSGLVAGVIDNWTLSDWTA